MTRYSARLLLSLLLATGLGVPKVLRGATPRPARHRGHANPKNTKATRHAAAKPSSKSAHVSRVSAKTNPAARVVPTSSKAASKSKSARRSKKSGKRQKGQMTPTADRISAIQEALARDGSFSGSPTGKWDDSTTGAMKRFQEAHGLNPTGKLDAKTLQQLGLGSSTAGLAPPMPGTSSAPAAQKATQTASRQ